MSDQELTVHLKTDAKEINLRTGGLPPVYQYQGFAYTLESIDSVIELIKWKGSKENTVIFCDQKGIQVILDDTVKDRPQDTARYAYLVSLEWGEWNKCVNQMLNQKAFVDFLRRRPEGEIENFESLLAAVQTFKVATQINGEFAYEDSNNVKVIFKMGEKEGSVHLPKVLYVTIPLIYGSDKKFAIEVELEFTVPKAENEKPAFKLTVPKWDRYWKDAVDHEVSRLKSALEGYLILDGRGL